MGRRQNRYDHSLRMILVISCVYPMGPAATILMPMIVGGLIDGYGFVEQEAALIGSLEGLGVVVALVAAAFWVRKVAWTKAVFIGCLLTAAINLFSTTVSDLELLMIARFLAGLFAGTLFSVTVAALGDNREPDRAFGVAQGLQGILMFAGFAVAPGLIQAYGVNGMYYLLAAASLVMMLSLVRFPAQGVNHAELMKLAGGDTHTGLIALGLFSSFIFFIASFGFWAFAERIGQAAGLSADTIGYGLGASQILAISGGVIAAVVSDRFGRTLPLLLVIIGQSSVYLALLGQQFSAATFYICTGIFQALFVIGVSYQMGVIAKLDVKGKFLVVVTAAQALGAAFAPSTAAFLIKEGGDYSGVLLLSLSLCIVSGVLFLFINKHSVRMSQLCGAIPSRSI